MRTAGILLLLFTAASGFFDIDELKNDIFDVGIAGDPVSLHTDVNGKTLILSPQGFPVESSSSVMLGNRNGQAYVCLFPEPANPSKNESVKSVYISNQNITSRLDVLQRLSCLRKTVSWWTYELCPGGEIKQFHMDNNVIKGEVLTLGRFEANENWDINISLTDGEKPVPFLHTQYYTNGTLCNVNNKLRKAEVKFICEENVSAYLHRVDEPSSCQYLFTVKTGFLCDMPGFKPLEARKPVSVQCKPALTPEQMDSYLESLGDDEFFATMEDEEEKSIFNQRRSFMEMIFGPNEDKRVIDSLIDDSVFNEDSEGEDNSDASLIRDARLRDFYRKDQNSDRAAVDTAAETEAIVKMQKLMDKLLKRRAEKLGLNPNHVKTFSMDLNPGRTQEASENHPTASKVTTAQVAESVPNAPESARRGESTAAKAHLPEEDSDNEALLEFDEGLGKIKPDLTKLEIDQIKETMSQELDSIVNEAEKELREEGYEDVLSEGADKSEALKTLSQTLTKLLKRIDDTERSIRLTNELLDEASGKLADMKENTQKKDSFGETDSRDSDFEYSETQVKLPGGQLHVQQHSSKGGEKTERADVNNDINDRVRVRVSKVKTDPSSRATNSMSDLLRRKINSQSQVLEDQLAEKLKKAGFDPKGRHVQVKIVTSGYFQDEGDEGEFEVLSDAQTNQFSNLIVSLLAGDQQAKEQRRMEQLEDNYNFDPKKQSRGTNLIKKVAAAEFYKLQAGGLSDDSDRDEDDEADLFF